MISVRSSKLTVPTQEPLQDLLINWLVNSLRANARTQLSSLTLQLSCHHLLNGIDLSQVSQKDSNSLLTIMRLLTHTLSSMIPRSNSNASKIKLQPRMLEILKLSILIKLMYMHSNMVFHQLQDGDLVSIESLC